jgi:hypothetical protein
MGVSAFLNTPRYAIAKHADGTRGRTVLGNPLALPGIMDNIVCGGVASALGIWAHGEFLFYCEPIHSVPTAFGLGRCGKPCAKAAHCPGLPRSTAATMSMAFLVLEKNRIFSDVMIQRGPPIAAINPPRIEGIEGIDCFPGDLRCATNLRHHVSLLQQADGERKEAEQLRAIEGSQEPQGNALQRWFARVSRKS